MKYFLWMGDYNVSFWGPEQNKIEKLRKQSTPNIHTTHMWETNGSFQQFHEKLTFFWVSAPLLLLLSQMRSGILWSFQFMSVRIIVRFWNEKEEVVQRGYVVHEKLERCVSHVDFYIFSRYQKVFENWLKYFWRSLFFTKWILIMMNDWRFTQIFVSLMSY